MAGAGTVGSPRPVARRSALVVLCIAVLMVNLDNTILNVALPTLVEKLNATTDQLQWIVDAYAMVFGGTLLTAGSLADRYGRRRLFALGLVTFGVGSLGAAFSGSVDPLIAWRAVMGVGAAMTIPAGLATINELFSEPAQRAKAVGAWSGTMGLGIAIGPVVGGLLLSRFWWGSVFLVNVPVAIAGVVGTLLLVPESRSRTVRVPDPWGALLSIAGLGLVLWAVIEGPDRGWTSPAVLGVGAGGIVLVAAFLAWENRIDHPLLPLSYFRSRRFSAPVAALFLGVFSLFGGLFVVTQFLQFDLGYTPLEAGVRLLPISAGLALGALASARLVRWCGSKLIAAGGLACIVAGLTQIASVSTVASTFHQQLPGMILIGLGAGLLIPTATDSVLGALDPDDAGVGSATNSTSLQVGGAVGVAVIGSVLSTHYQHAMRAALAGHALPATAAHAILGSIGGALIVARTAGGALGTALAHAARAGFMTGYHAATIVGAAVTLAAVILALATIPSRAMPGRRHRAVGDE
jgi:EmrB/QacA subfamily drug resistance transporter